MGLFTRIELSTFRNINNIVIEPGKGFNILYGENGSGKTNILEALFFVSIGKSQRGASPRDFIRFGSDHFIIRTLTNESGTNKEIRASGTAKGHSFFINNERLHSAADLLGNILTVSISPDDLFLSSGPPIERRRYLNMLLSQADINYFIALVDYNRTLAERNACLKWNTPDTGFLSVLTEALIKKGAIIRSKRRKLIETLTPFTDDILRVLTEGEEKMTITYRPEGSFEQEQVEKELEKTFRAVEKQEMAMQMTLAGPHRDDFDVMINSRPAARFASRGQERSISLALKLAAVRLLKSLKGGPCVLLLDDIFAELDENRCSNLINLVRGNDQVFAASPQIMRFTLPEQSMIYHIDRGAISEHVSG